MADGKDQDYQPLVLDIADDPIVADAVAPQLAETGTLQCLAETTRIVPGGNSIGQVAS